jgi:hypothetical protein
LLLPGTGTDVLLQQTVAAMAETDGIVTTTLQPRLDRLEDTIQTVQKDALKRIHEGDSAVQGTLMSLLEEKVALVNDSNEKISAQLADHAENSSDERRKIYEFVGPIGEKAASMEADLAQALSEQEQKREQTEQHVLLLGFCSKHMTDTFDGCCITHSQFGSIHTHSKCAMHACT